MSVTADQVKACAGKAGFLACGITRPAPNTHAVELDEWLAQSTAHEVAYVRLESAWARTERLVVLRPLVPEQVSPAKSVRWFFTPVAMRAAAAFALVAVLGGAAAYFLLQPRDRTYTTPIGGRETIAFADGTRIELNTNTVLRARMTTESRTVWLDSGEACLLRYVFLDASARDFIDKLAKHDFASATATFDEKPFTVSVARTALSPISEASIDCRS